MSSKLCPTCQGYKKSIGSGGMSYACAVCNGSGWIMDTNKIIEDQPIIKKSRGRPKQS